jgi:hypothetical protein
MENIWKFIINSFNYFNIFKINKEPEIINETEIINAIEINKESEKNKEPDYLKSPMEHYLIHNDPNIMSEWDYLIRLHIR